MNDLLKVCICKDKVIIRQTDNWEVIPFTGTEVRITKQVNDDLYRVKPIEYRDEPVIECTGAVLQPLYSIVPIVRDNLLIKEYRNHKIKASEIDKRSNHMANVLDFRGTLGYYNVNDDINDLVRLSLLSHLENVWSIKQRYNEVNKDNQKKILSYEHFNCEYSN